MGMTSHRGFPISLPSVAMILALSAETDGDLSKSTVRERTELGTVYAEAMPRYAQGAGLLLDDMRPSEFGYAALKWDPGLGNPNTVWLAHYYLSASWGHGPAYWSWVMARDFALGETLRSTDIARSVQRFGTSSGLALSEATCKRCADALLGTYWRSDGLGRLGLVEHVGAERGAYRVQEPQLPSMWVVASALTHFWSKECRDAQEVLFRSLTAEGGFASLFFLGPGLLGSILSELQSAGVLLVRRDVPPFMVVRLWPDGETFLERLYE